VASLVSAGLLALLGSQVLTPAQNQSNAAVSPLLGHPAPDFTLAVLSTHPAPAIHLASLKGKPVMLNFWASWCDVCKAEAPLLQNTWQRFQSQGVVFVGIDIQDTRSDALNFLQTYGITYPNVVDPSGSVTINYGVTGVPETFFLNRQGVIVKKVIGELTEQTLENNLQAISRSA
jgi:cytochrome c biogenesis protein CcmG/thiol:disulfide interchange protein DsbE